MVASNASLTTISGLFKRKYGKLESLLPKGYAFQEFVGEENMMKDGESIQVGVQLSHENGVTFAGSDSSVTFNDQQSLQIKQASINSMECFLSSGILTSALAKSAGAGEQAFESATKKVVGANLKSHMRFREQTMLYGQDASGLGRVNYQTSTFRGVSFTDGGATIGGVVITAGVNTSSKHIMLDPNDIASGLWIGSEGLEIEQIITATGAVADTGSAKGKVVSVDIRNGIIKVDFTPVVASAVGSHHLKLKGQSDSYDMIGAKKILTNSGTLFGINAAAYSMWAGSNQSVSGKLTFAKLTNAIEELCDMGLDRDVEVQVGFETWSDLLNEQAALRSYDSSYDPSKVENGAKKIEFHFVNGLVRIVANRFVRRSEAFILAVDDWKLVGASVKIGLKIPGSDGDDLITPPITGNTYIFRSYSSSQVFCHAPRRSMVLIGINPEATS